MSAAVASDSCQDGKIGGDMVLISGEVSFDSLNHYGSCDKDGPLHVAVRGGRNEGVDSAWSTSLRPKRETMGI